MNARGLTLLETMVALVILGLVVVGYLELFGGALRAADDSRIWSQAVAYAEDAMERAKLDSIPYRATGPEALEGGFGRRVETLPWTDGLVRIAVVVTLPGGGSYELDRLAAVP